MLQIVTKNTDQAGFLYVQYNDLPGVISENHTSHSPANTEVKVVGADGLKVFEGIDRHRFRSIGERHSKSQYVVPQLKGDRKSQGFHL